MEKTAFDPKRRRLCPDGACVGVIGPDGKCRECGRADAGGASAAGAGDAGMSAVDVQAHDSDYDSLRDHDHVQVHDHDDDVDGEVSRDVDGKAANGAGKFDPRRKLCTDGTCLGVIGPNGECPVCGTRAEA